MANFLGMLPGRNSLASNIGSDIGQVLQTLASHKANQMQTKQLERVGFPKELASVFHTLSPDVQKGIWNQINLSNIGQQQQPEFAPQQLQQSSQPTYTPAQENVLRSIPESEARNRLAQQFQTENRQQNLTTEPSARIGQAAAQQQAVQAAQPQNKSIFNAPVDKLAEQKALADYKDQLGAAREQQKLEHQDVKESKQWLKETNKKTKAVKENNARLDRMEKLVRSGKLNSATLAATLDTVSHGLWGVGINLKSLLSPESQEFEKLSNDMLSGIQDMFGSRILKTEVDTYLKTIPTLLQSDAGKIAVIENLKLFNEAKIAQDKTAKEIIKENGGKVPADLELMVDDRLDAYLDDLHNRFVNQQHTPIEQTKSQKVLSALNKVPFIK